MAADNRWETVGSIAIRNRVEPAEVARTLAQLGVAESKTNSRGEGQNREYSHGIVLLVERELMSRGRLKAGRS